ncbi:hypothetical protein ACLKA6_013932 [Drosophila palustris]
MGSRKSGEETGSSQSLDKVFYGNKISVEVVGKLPAAAPLAQFVVRVCHDVGDDEDDIITDVATIWQLMPSPELLTFAAPTPASVFKLLN